MAGLQRYSLIVRLTLTALYDGKRSYWLKQAEKDHKISEDQHHEYGQDIQKLTDDAIKKIDESLAGKEQEIMQV